MSKRDALKAKYAADLEKLGMKVDADLLHKAVLACGPSIYSADAETVAGSDAEEIERVRKNFVAKRLGITDEAAGKAAVDAGIEAYGRSNRNKYRPVLYYIIAQQTGKTAAL